MGKSVQKNFFREIKNSKGRFISILFIVAMGVAFFSGVRATEPDMRLTMNQFVQDHDFMDIRVLSTLGLTDDDLDAIGKVEGVSRIEGGYDLHVMTDREDETAVLEIMSIPEKMNRMTVVQGTLPKKETECLADSLLAEEWGVKVGDKISVYSGTEDELSDSIKHDTFTVTGIGDTPGYLTTTRDSAKIGSGTVKGFLAVPAQAFCMDAWTVAYLRADELKSLGTYDQEYTDRIDAISEKIESLKEERCAIRLADMNAEIKDAEKEIADGVKELEDAEKELEDGKKELEDGRAEYEENKQSAYDKLADAQSEINSGQRQINSGYSSYRSNKNKLASSKNELAKNEKTLAEAKAELEDGKRELSAGKTESAAGKKQLDALKQRMDALKKQIDGLKSQQKSIAAQEKELAAQEKELKAKKQELSAQKKSLDATLQGLKAQKKELTSQEQNLKAQKKALSGEDADAEAKETVEASLKQVEAALSQVKSGISQTESGLSQVNAGLSQVESGLSQVQGAKSQISSGKTQLESGLKEAEEGYAQMEQAYQSGLKEWETGQKQIKKAETDLKKGESKLAYNKNQKKIESGKSQIASGESQLEAGRRTLNQKQAELNSGQRTLNSNKRKTESELSKAEKKLADAEKEIKDGEKEIKDGWKEINDAKEELADAKEKIADLGDGEWYVLDRSENQAFAEYDADADKIGSIGKVFPLVFFLVAALVSLTTMTRMVEEQRGQIGVYEALGYGKGVILGKFAGYCLLATVAGSIIGILFGEKVFPFVIIRAYGNQYLYMNAEAFPYEWKNALLAAGAAIACNLIATLWASAHLLRSNPAQLMRPTAPKLGEKIFLEHFPNFWRKLTFSMKATLRNIFRYKKRLFMTIIGIGGCTALILTGFGINDSVGAVTANQYGEIWTYDAQLNLDPDAKESVLADLHQLLDESEVVKKQMSAYQETADVSAAGQTAAETKNASAQTAADEENNAATGTETASFQMEGNAEADSAQTSGNKKEAWLLVPLDEKVFPDFIHLRDRKSGETYTLSPDQVIMTEKISTLLGVQAGNRIRLQMDDEKDQTVQIRSVTENYMMHYVYMTPGMYQNLYGKEPQATTIFINYANVSEKERDAFVEKVLKNDAVLSLSKAEEAKHTMTDTTEIMGVIVGVLTGAAGILAFIVIFNLNNISITERRRELATLKVLGFYDGEVAAYVYRENVFLTAFGIVLGLGFGIYLHHFIMNTAETDILMFGRVISPVSYLAAILLTAVFAVFVNGITYFSLRRINMIESLKSVE